MQMVAKREGTGIIHKLSVWSIIDNNSNCLLLFEHIIFVGLFGDLYVCRLVAMDRLYLVTEMIYLS